MARQHWFATLLGLSVEGPAPVSFISRPDLQGPWSVAPSEPQLSSSDGLEAPWLNPEEQVCLEQVHQVLLGSRKPSTRATYFAKWKQFFIWSSQHGILPLSSSLQVILEYLLHLKQQVLAISSVKVHLA